MTVLGRGGRGSPGAVFARCFADELDNSAFTADVTYPAFEGKSAQNICSWVCTQGKSQAGQGETLARSNTFTHPDCTHSAVTCSAFPTAEVMPPENVLNHLFR